MKAKINFTSDNENMAIEEIRTILEDAGFEVKKVKVVNSNHARRNVYGNEMPDEDFNDLDSDSNETWFDDYDLTLIVELYSDEMTDEEIKEFLEENIDGFEADSE